MPGLHRFLLHDGFGLSTAAVFAPVAGAVSEVTFWKGQKNGGLNGITLPETNSSHLKIDGWNTSFLFGWPISGGYVSF